LGNVVQDPVCGMNLDQGKAGTAGLQIEHQGKSYYFCSATCQKQFNQTPERYAAKPEISPAPKQVESPPKIQVAPEKTQDPVCGHEVDETQAKAAGLTSIYQGKTYYFCSYRCNKQFDQDPGRYVHQEGLAERAASKTEAAAKNVKDPVCGLEVAKAAAKGSGRTSEYQGKLYYFDTDGCKERFDKDPQHYLSGSSSAMQHEIQPYPKVPLESDMQLRYKRTLMRMAPQGPTPERPPGATPEPAQKSQVQPAAPQIPPMKPPAQPSAPPQPQAPPPPHPPGGGGHQHD
jgi:YHS domain-containing protein